MKTKEVGTTGLPHYLDNLEKTGNLEIDPRKNQNFSQKPERVREFNTTLGLGSI